MQIVINVPDKVWNKAKEYGHLDICGIELSERVMNGTPLPKGDGRLLILSEDIVEREQTLINFSCLNWISEVGLSNATVAIIEADKE